MKQRAPSKMTWFRKTLPISLQSPKAKGKFVVNVLFGLSEKIDLVFILRQSPPQTVLLLPIKADFYRVSGNWFRGLSPYSRAPHAQCPE